MEEKVKAVCHGKVSGSFNLCNPLIILLVVHSPLSGLDVPFRLPNPDACVDSNLDCPLKKSVTYQYDASFPVLKVYPRVDVVVKYELKTSSGKDIVCVLIPVKIQ